MLLLLTMMDEREGYRADLLVGWLLSFVSFESCWIPQRRFPFLSPSFFFFKGFSTICISHFKASTTAHSFRLLEASPWASF